MWRWMHSLLQSKPACARAAQDLLVLPAADIKHVLQDRSGMPHVDWGMAQAWASRETDDPRELDRHRRAIAGVWLDAVCGSLRTDHKRWRHTFIEGLAPIENGVAQRVAECADRAVAVITQAMEPITGREPIAPVGVVALQTKKDYYSFIAPFYPDEGEFATSGGIYCRALDWSWPVIAMPVEGNRHDIEKTVAHELTHHALSKLDIPNWAEEGLTQMMEERVTGHPSLDFDFEIRQRHAEHWDAEALGRFWSGEAFHSPLEDEQKLAYNLSQLIVRGLLSTRPRQFFAFARAATTDDCGAAAAREHLGMTLDDLAANVQRGPA